MRMTKKKRNIALLSSGVMLLAPAAVIADSNLSGEFIIQAESEGSGKTFVAKRGVVNESGGDAGGGGVIETGLLQATFNCPTGVTALNFGLGGANGSLRIVNAEDGVTLTERTLLGEDLGANIATGLTPGVDYILEFEGTADYVGNPHNAAGSLDHSRFTTANCLRSIDSWNDELGLTSATSLIVTVNTLESMPNNIPTTITNIDSLFAGGNFDGTGLSSWNTSNVNTMRTTFSINNTFNAPIGGWDVSNVTNMFAMFDNTNGFNQDISNWDMSGVTNVKDMFRGNTSFQNGGQPLNWGGTFSSVTDMSNMFHGASFNQPINDWDTSSVTTMANLFNDSDFNQPINNWDLSSLATVSSMFYQASFNQNISNWPACVFNSGGPNYPASFETANRPANLAC